MKKIALILLLIFPVFAFAQSGSTSGGQPVIVTNVPHVILNSGSVTATVSGAITTTATATDTNALHVLRQMTGYYGSLAVRDSVRHLGSWFAITFLRDAYVDTILNNGVVQHRLDTIPAGTVLYGNFTKVKMRKYAGKYPPMYDLQNK